MRTIAKKWTRFREFYPLLLMALPGIAYFVINNYIPMSGLVVAFKQYNVMDGIWGSRWIGLKNFDFLFGTNDAYIITRNTLLYNVAFIVLETVVAIGLAVLLNEVASRVAKRVYQSVMLLPHLISMVIVSFLVYGFLSTDSGLLNKGILSTPISWYTEAAYWPCILIIVRIWKSCGYLCIVYYASIIGIDQSYYEAAKLDGASRWQQLIYITLPMIKSTVIMMVLLAVGRIFYSDFGLFYQVPMNSGMLFSTTNVIDTYTYRGLMTLGNIGMASAAGLYQSVVGFALVSMSNLIVKKLSPEDSLF